MSKKSFKDELKELGLTKSRLADELELSPEQVSRWKNEPPGYARAYLTQVKKNKLIQQKLDAFMKRAESTNSDSSSSEPALKRIAYITDIISDDERTIALFTRGLHLEFRENGTGYSGNWVLDPERHFDKVVIYLRKDGGSEVVNEIYLADFIWSEGPVDARRYRVHFKNLHQVGVTEKHWKEFTNRGVNPVKYYGSFPEK